MQTCFLWLLGRFSNQIYSASRRLASGFCLLTALARSGSNSTWGVDLHAIDAILSQGLTSGTSHVTVLMIGSEKV